jgi:hypothetical protein
MVLDSLQSPPPGGTTPRRSITCSPSVPANHSLSGSADGVAGGHGLALARQQPPQPDEIHCRCSRPRAVQVDRSYRERWTRRDWPISLRPMGDLDLLPISALVCGQDQASGYRTGRVRTNLDLDAVYMHTIKIVLGGLLPLAVCLLLGRWMGDRLRQPPPATT